VIVIVVTMQRVCVGIRGKPRQDEFTHPVD
jgi:hypothetical protein